MMHKIKCLTCKNIINENVNCPNCYKTVVMKLIKNHLHSINCNCNLCYKIHTILESIDNTL